MYYSVYIVSLNTPDIAVYLIDDLQLQCDIDMFYSEKQTVAGVSV